MLGHLSPELLAAGGLVNICYGFIMIIFWGIFTTLGTLISRHKGGESFESISHLFKSALVLAGVFGSIIALFFFLAIVVHFIEAQMTHSVFYQLPLFIVSSMIFRNFFLISTSSQFMKFKILGRFEKNTTNSYHPPEFDSLFFINIYKNHTPTKFLIKNPQKFIN
jgi:Na+-driven multidrug efflux pump